VRVVCEELSVADLFEIMKRSEGSIIRQYERAFRAYGIEVNFEDEALWSIAKLAGEEKTGARGLLTVCERILRNFKYELPGAGVARFTVHTELIEQPDETLKQLLAEGHQEREKAMAAVACEYAQRFTEKYGVHMEFSEEAVSRLVVRAGAEGVHMRDLCERLFRDYEFGLKLVLNHGAPQTLVVPGYAIDDPDKFLSEWLVQRYRNTPEA
jgi:ATP-dependent protease Clp ATPase subunit